MSAQDLGPELHFQGFLEAQVRGHHPYLQRDAIPERGDHNREGLVHKTHKQKYLMQGTRSTPFC